MDRLRELGYTPAIVERWNHFAGVRQDLFGFVDIIAVGNGHTLAVQATSRSNISSRVNKIKSIPAARDCIMAGWAVEVWGWKEHDVRVVRIDSI